MYGKCLLDRNNNDAPAPFMRHENDMMAKLESVQYKAALMITGTWQGTSTKKFTNYSVGNIFHTVVGTDKCAFFSKSSKVKHLLI